MRNNACAYCATTIDDDHGLCPQCELRFGITLARLSVSIQPLRDMLDATVHYGGHEQSRIQTATPPTPIRLEVLDLLDDIETYAYELAHLTLGERAEDTQMPMGDLLQMVMGVPSLAAYGTAGRYMREACRLMSRVDLLLDPPDLHDIGHCPNPLCGVVVRASRGQERVRCEVCGQEATVGEIQARTLDRLRVSSRTGTAGQIARVMTDCGITMTRKRINNWASRKKLEPAGRLGNRPVYRYADVYRLAVS